MVRFYILPNADHLTEDELNFELTLRNVQVAIDAKLEEKTRALRYAYKTERVDPKLYDTGLSIIDEAKNLEKTIKALKKSLRETFDYVIVSRLRHYLIRLSSASAANEEEKELKMEYCKEIEEIMRAHRQRVTYDPEHSNDETDQDLGEGAKALKDSWRNPNPQALVQTANLNRSIVEGKINRSRTGTWPKELKGKEEKGRGFYSDKSLHHSDGTKEIEIGKKRVDPTPLRKKEKHGEKTNNTPTHKNDERNHNTRSKHKKDYRRTRSTYSATEDSDSDESEKTEDSWKKKNAKTSRRSRGRSFLTSTSSSSTEEEEELGRWGRHRDSARRSVTPPRRARSYRDDLYRSSRSRVENWDIIFTGDSRSMQVEDFLNRVKKLAKHERVEKKELLDKIHYKLKGEASDWWFTREHHCTSWEKFENEIRFRFGNPNRDRGIRAQLRELRQKRGETFVAFVTEVEKLNQCLKHPHSSRTVFEIVWENMRPHYRSKLATTRVRNLEHLLDLNHRIDATDLSLYRSSSNMRNDIHNIEAQSYSEGDNSSVEEHVINALQRKPKFVKDAQKSNAPSNTQILPSTDTSAVKCWNCQKTGHHWRTCKETKLIFCYACGNLGRTTRTCERNHPQLNFSNQNSSNSQSLN